jgi:hypothetical protein
MSHNIVQATAGNKRYCNRCGKTTFEKQCPYIDGIEQEKIKVEQEKLEVKRSEISYKFWGSKSLVYFYYYY